MAQTSTAFAKSTSPALESGSWRWETTARGSHGIETLTPAWDELVRTLGLPFVSGALWLRCFWNAFGEKDKELAVLAARRDGRVVAIVPLLQDKRLLRTWSPVANFHSPSLVFAAESPPAGAAAAVLEQLLQSGDVLDIGPVPPGDSFCEALRDAARSLGLPVVEDTAENDAILELRGPWEQFRRSLSRNLEQSTARHHRQLQKFGVLAFDEVTGGARLAAVLEECFQLEAAGWKATHGSPILARQDTLRFYTDLAHQAADAGALAVYVLRLDGKLIAFEYCLRAGRRIDMLKISYAPDLGRYSPGNVLRQMVLKTEIERGTITIYHMGHASDWKLRWANRVDPTVRLRIYGRGARARFAYYGARSRVMMKQCAPLRAAVRRLRSARDAVRHRWNAARAKRVGA
jgi:CelD/BcsL family acetyltransferase involved in cellulose biosynthesis